jgi:3'-5' exonuclease
VARTPLAEYLVLDIETVPDTERWSRPEPPMPEPPPEPPSPTAPATPEAPPPPPPPRRDRERRGGDRSDRGDAFPPTWAHRIITIGCLWLDHAYRLKKLDVIRAPAESSVEQTADARERALLERLSRFVGAARPVLVTYNGRSFDLPVIALRSLCHAVPIGWYYRDSRVRYRYTEEGHLDLCDWLADHGAVRAGKLDALARLIGLPGKTGIDGSQVEGLFLEGKLDAIDQYCLADVAQTAFLFLRFRLLQGRLTPDAYRHRATALIDALTADGRLGEVVAGLDRAQLLAGEA